MDSEVKRPGFAPVLVELLLNLIGIFGVGWLMAGYRFAGMLYLVFSLAWLATAAVVLPTTSGFGLICLGPLDLILLLLSTLLLLARVRSTRARER